jgi:hypothetical protein
MNDLGNSDSFVMPDYPDDCPVKTARSVMGKSKPGRSEKSLK